MQNIVGWKKKHLTVAKVVPTEPAEPLVLFQTRLFDPMKQVKTNEVAALNQSRINIVRALRAAFGKNFIGGFIPNSYTVQHYPDLLTNENTARNKYFELVKRCLVVVFTRGLRQSIGWRLPELLAMSRCVVSEPLAYKLPVPLRENVNYLLFDEPDQCIEACKTLLNNSDLAQQMRKNNYDYYHRYVEASALIRNTLEAASKMMNSI